MINRTAYFTLLIFLPTVSPANNSIRIENSALSDRDTGSIYITMKTEIPINGFNFILSFDPSIIKPLRISPIGRALAAIVTDAYVYESDRMSFVVFNRNGPNIPADSGRIFEIKFAVNDSILSHDSTTQILFFQSSVADSNLAIVPFEYEHGNIAIHHITSVKDPLADMPHQFELFQNYPNPFNPTTTIRYDIPIAGHVSLVIYNILGQQVRELVDEMQYPGVKSVIWDARNSSAMQVASGVYIYRLQASVAPGGSNAFTDVKKMILLK